MRPTLSLPARLSLAVMAVLVIVTVLADIMAMRELRARLTDSVADSLSWMIGRAAGQLDQDVAMLREILAGEAEAMRGTPASGAEEALREADASLRFAFDLGILMVDASGRVLADSRNRPELTGLDVSEREFFQRTFALQKPQISEPFALPEAGDRPLVVFTHPVRDRSGRMHAFLAGCIDLENNRILGRYTGASSSRHGQIGVFTMDGGVVAHSEKNLILETYENPLPDQRTLDNSNVTAEITTGDGSRAILAACRLRETEWLIAGVFPVRELYRPIDRGFAAAHRWFAAGLAVCCIFVLLISRRTVKDLGTLAAEVEAVRLHRDGIYPEGVGTGYRGEAGMLAETINLTLESLAAARRDVEDLAARLAETEERERRAIASGLHDSVCQTLAFANMRLGAAGKSCDDETGRNAIDAARGLIEQSVEELKTLIFDLSPVILYELGLVPTLERYAGEFSKRHGIPVAVEAPEPFGEIDDERAIFLYRAAGELLTNAVKHARASRIALRVRRSGDIALLEVADDGIGISSGTVDKAGYGLLSLRLRARQFGGGLELSPAGDKGTLARVSVSVRKSAGGMQKGGGKTPNASRRL